jgi:uncharacterized protein
MSFWDSSAIITIFLPHQSTHDLNALSKADDNMAVWWGTTVEVHAGLMRLQRMGEVDEDTRSRLLREALNLLMLAADIDPTDEICELACRVAQLYPLTAADALQLAAALVWAEHQPRGLGFVCLDDRLREAAYREGFEVLPK